MSLKYASVDNVFATVEQQVQSTPQTQRISVRKALGHVLSHQVNAAHDIPRFDNSAMDGYVFRKEDLKDGRTEFPVAYEIRPEDTEVPALGSGTCARIMTGARIPRHGTQVVPVEMVEERGATVKVNDIPGRNPIRPRGEGYAEGQVLLKSGTVIRPYEVGLMIEAGHRHCTVRRPIEVGLQVTGSEINEKNDTNGPVLERLMRSWPGVSVDTWPVLGDDPAEVKERLGALKAASDVVVTTGGISAGKHDYLYRTMEELGAKCLVRKIAQKPGKPFTLFLWDGTPVCHPTEKV